jgi:hypothetical protein
LGALLFGYSKFFMMLKQRSLKSLFLLFGQQVASTAVLLSKSRQIFSVPAVRIPGGLTPP